MNKYDVLSMVEKAEVTGGMFETIFIRAGWPTNESVVSTQETILLHNREISDISQSATYTIQPESSKHDAN